MAVMGQIRGGTLEMTLTLADKVTSIRTTPYTFPSTGKYLMCGCFQTSGISTIAESSFTTSGCTIDSDTYTVEPNNYGSSNYMLEIVGIVDVTSSGATIQNTSTAVNAQAWQFWKIN